MGKQEPAALLTHQTVPSSIELTCYIIPFSAATHAFSTHAPVAKLEYNLENSVSFENGIVSSD